MGRSVQQHNHAAAVCAEIQGLRALAIVAVLLFHIWPGAAPNGFLGVDMSVTFTLSVVCPSFREIAMCLHYLKVGLLPLLFSRFFVLSGFLMAKCLDPLDDAESSRARFVIAL